MIANDLGSLYKNMDKLEEQLANLMTEELETLIFTLENEFLI